MRARYIIVPGWHGSDHHHWQTHWERTLPGAERIVVGSWEHPGRHDWTSALERAVATASQPPILIAHSLGCIAVAHWAATTKASIRGAFFVAPADLDRRETSDVLLGFAPVPHR